jgi:hypothetical protein
LYGVKCEGSICGHTLILLLFLFGVKRKVAVKIEMIIRITAGQNAVI